MEKQAEIFTSPYCVGCKLAKKFFEDKKIDYIERDIIKDELAKQELTSLGISSLPVIRYGGKMVIGFQKVELENLIDNK